MPVSHAIFHFPGLSAWVHFQAAVPAMRLYTVPLLSGSHRAKE